MEKQWYDMCLILNTHWDREYRWSFRETQMRLLEAVDALVDIMEKDPRFAFFHTDSQASMIDDYLELRPERRERVCKLVGEGRILTGPWYTLPAEYLVSGEALVRNLLTGHRIARDLGNVMKAGYNIFSWGQVSQLPQIYRQFGMDTILFYRGVDQSSLDKLEFWWEAPDDSRALAITFGSFHRLNFWVYVYLPYVFGDFPAGFDRTGRNGFITHLCDPASSDLNHHVVNQAIRRDGEKALGGMKRLLQTLVDKSSTPHLLFLQGFDQENPDPIVPDLVDWINSQIDYGKIRVTNLPEYIATVRKSLEESGATKTLERRSGEMLAVEKVGDAFGPLYIGVFSARMPVKLRNHDCQYRLEKWAEPAAVLARLRGADYPVQPLRMAWREILQNQQHDGIGGCHVDRVFTSMLERYDNARDIGETVTRDALHHLVASIDLSHVGEEEIGLVLFNSLPHDRAGVVRATIDMPIEWNVSTVGQKDYHHGGMPEIIDESGSKVPCQVIRQWDETPFAYLKFGSATRFQATRFEVAIEAGTVPAMGYTSLTARPKRSFDRPVETLAPRPGVLENVHLRAEIRPDGTVDLTDKQTGHTYSRLHYFEDGGDQGGPLTFVPPTGDAVFTTIGEPADVALVAAGPLIATYRVTREWMLPEGLESETRIHVPHGAQWIDHGPLCRSELRRALRIRTEITLRKASRVLEFHTTVENNVRDHRLRLAFPTGISEAVYCDVDSPFDVVKRPIAVPDSSGWYEPAARTWPTASFVDVNDGHHGLAVMHRGITEYEVTDNADRAVILTLLRCFATSGNPSETHVQQPLAQCPATHEFQYWVKPHFGKAAETYLPRVVTEMNVPVRIAQCTAHPGTMPRGFSFFRLEPDCLVYSILKKAEGTDAVVFRCYNPTAQPVDGVLTVNHSFDKFLKATLEEVPIEPLKLDVDNGVRFHVGKGEIVTIMME